MKTFKIETYIAIVIETYDGYAWPYLTHDYSD